MWARYSAWSRRRSAQILPPRLRSTVKGAGLPEALLRIPLAITGLSVAAQRRNEHVSIVDALPTLAEWTGQEIPAAVQGRSLASLQCGEPALPEEFGSIHAELGYGGICYDEHSRPPQLSPR